MASERQKITELNKVILIQGNSRFEAYLTSEIEYTGENNVEDLSAANPGMISTVIANIAFDKVPAFDIPRYYAYKGTGPISFSFSCVLTLKTDPMLDFNDPLTTLYGMAFPSRSGTSLKTHIDNTIKKVDTTLSNIPILGTLYDLMKEGISFTGSMFPDAVKKGASQASQGASNILSQTYFLNIPPAFQFSTEGDTGIRMYVGTNRKIIYENLVIKAVSVHVPKLVLGAGYPTNIQVSITVETLRIATTQVLTGFLFKPDTQN